jgi:UDPglucose 6-dehydrogenase
MNITVLGSGYVGLVTAAGLSEIGNQVLCVDIDATRIEALHKGVMPFFEPGLRELVARGVRSRRLTFSTRIEPPFTTSDVYFIAVGTPPAPDGRADVSAVFTAAESIARTAARPAIIAVKSTVPVGTCDEVERLVRGVEAGWHVTSNPEFLKEGAALDDFFRPDRVLIGAEDAHAARVLRELYEPLQIATERTLVVDRRSSELAKYAANAMLAVRISFMNELARLCDRLGADITSIRRAIGSDHRIGPHFLYAGPGYGGSCFPKDVSALIAIAADVGQSLEVVKAASTANELQRAYVLQRVQELFPDGLSGKKIAIWGLAFKPETDDVRDSPAAPLVKELVRCGAAVRAHDPEAAATFAKLFAPEIAYCESEYDALDGADALVLMTEWRQYRNPDFDSVRRRMAVPRIVDARNIWERSKLSERGFEYRGIGIVPGARA